MILQGKYHLIILVLGRDVPAIPNNEPAVLVGSAYDLNSPGALLQRDDSQEARTHPDGAVTKSSMPCSGARLALYNFG